MKRFHFFPHSLGAKMWHQVSNSLRCIWGTGQKMNVILFLNFRAHLFFPSEHDVENVKLVKLQNWERGWWWMQRKRGDRGTGRYSVWTDLDLSVLQTCERKLFGICVFINQGFRTEQRGRKKNVDVFLGKGFHHC